MVEKLKNFLTSPAVKDRIRRLLISFGAGVAVSAVLSGGTAVFSLVTRGHVTVPLIYTVNYIVGSIIILVGLVGHMLPSGMGKNKSYDPATVEMIIKERDKRRQKAVETIFVGIGTLGVVSVIEYVIWVVAG